MFHGVTLRMVFVLLYTCQARWLGHTCMQCAQHNAFLQWWLAYRRGFMIYWEAAAVFPVFQSATLLFSVFCHALSVAPVVSAFLLFLFYLPCCRCECGQVSCSGNARRWQASEQHDQARDSHYPQDPCAAVWRLTANGLQADNCQPRCPLNWVGGSLACGGDAQLQQNSWCV